MKPLFPAIYALLFVGLLNVSVLHGAIKIGDSWAEVIQQLGQPSGATKMGDKEIMTYNGANVKLKNGLVYSIDKDFAAKQQEGIDRLEFAREQEAKGLQLYDGRWLTAKEIEASERAKAKAAGEAKAQQKQANGDYQDIRGNGQRVEMKSVLAPGKVTLVDFHADWCGPCKQINPYLMKLIKEDSSLALRKIDIVQWGTPVTEQFKINSIPNIRVYDRKGRLVGQPTSDLRAVMQYIDQAKRNS